PDKLVYRISPKGYFLTPCTSRYACLRGRAPVQGKPNEFTFTVNPTKEWFTARPREMQCYRNESLIKKSY
ncbi:MAG: hypothetical protein AAB766_02990, partial [Patescibacteria group bacterium]